MKRTKWSFYRLADGIFTSATYAASDDTHLSVNTPSGCSAIKGSFDLLSQRVDIETGEVVDYQPLRPSTDHEWNMETKRWQLTAEAQAIDNADRQARAELVRLDAQSHRYVAESVAGVIDDEGKRRLSAILARKEMLRKQLS